MKSKSPSTIESRELLKAKECEQVVRDLDAMISRVGARWGRYPVESGVFPASSYVHRQEDRDRYDRLWRDTNDEMRKTFGWVYERVFSQLADRFGVSISFRDGFAHPGFHVFELEKDDAGGSFVFMLGGGPHFDVDADAFTSKAPLEIISFTLVLQLPASGGGLDYWPEVTIADLKARGWEWAEKFHCSYSIGTLYFFDRPLLHNISPTKNPRRTDRRITLQGFVAKAHAGTWLAYF